MRHRNRPGRQTPILELMKRQVIFTMEALNGGPLPRSKRRNRGAARRVKIAAVRKREAYEKWRRDKAFTKKRKPVCSPAKLPRTP